jgi:hypothetical protein
MFNLVGRGLSCACAYPGRVGTMYRRTVAPTSTTLWRPLLLTYIHRTPFEGAQSVVHAATAPALPKLTPTFISDCKVRSHWRSRTCYDEKKLAGVVAWAQMQLKTAASSVKQKQQQQGQQQPQGAASATAAVPESKARK